jgi:hypothetical protein
MAIVGVTVSTLLTTSMGGARLVLITRSVLSLDLEFLMRQGAFARLMNVPISIYGGLATFPFGFGNSDLTVPGHFEILGTQYAFAIGKRNVGGFVELFLRFGVIGLIALGVYAQILWRVIRMRAERDGVSLRIGIAFAIALLLLTFSDGSIADPLAWLTVFVILRGTTMHRPAETPSSSLS